MKKKDIITAAAIAAATAGTIGIVQHVDALSTQYKTTTVLCMRTGPGTNYKLVRKLPKNQTVTVVSIDKYGWAKLSNGCYVSSIYLKKDSDTNINNNTLHQGTIKYAKCSLNLRKGPGTNYAKLRLINSGSSVKVLESYSSGWSKVSYQGSIGYVSSQYLITNKPQTQQKINKIIINRSKCTMSCYSDGKLIKSMYCAVGKKSTPTPRGTFTIVNKIKNRPYYKENIPGGDPRNPLGKYWLGLKVGKDYGQTYAIHGTNVPSSIGKAVSHGCIRLSDFNILWLYNNAIYGCVVVIY